MVLYPNKLPESERVCSGICTDDNSVFRIIEFRCAYIVYYKEVFNVDKKRPLFTTITLSADNLIVGNAFLTNSW